MRTSLFIGLIAFLLFFNGCGGENENDCKYEISYALDKGDYDSVIKTLEEQNQTCGFSEDEKNLNIAAAYIGKAGLTIVDIVNNMLESDSSGGDGFGSFIESMSSGDSAENLKYFNKAKTFYDKIPGNCKNLDTNSNNLLKDSCFYSGLMQISQSANSISLILGGSDEVEKWQDSSSLTNEDDKNNNQKADSVDAAARAIDYSLTGKTAPTSDNVYTDVDKNITFTKNNSNYTYELIKISVGTTNPNIFYKLISNDTPRSPIITDGSCSLTFQSCTTQNSTDCFPCPVIDDSGKAMNTNDQLVEVVNNGLDNIIEIANIGSDTNDGVGKSSDDYKKELDKDGDGEITLEEISDFLNKN